MDKISAIKAISRNLRDLVVDTTPASACGSHVDADKLIHPLANQLRGFPFYIYEGAGAGQDRTVGTFAPANNRMIFEQAFATVPSTNSKFLVFEHFDKDEYDNALDRMIGIARIKYLEEKVATMELVATQYEYCVPSGFEYISNLRLVPSGHTDYSMDDEVNLIAELPPRYWSIEPNAKGSYMIKFDPRKIDLQVVNEEWINVVGQAKPDISPTDNATIPEELEEFLIAGATMQLASQRISENQEWRDKFRVYRDLKNDLETYIHSNRYGRRVGA